MNHSLVTERKQAVFPLSHWERMKLALQLHNGVFDDRGADLVTIPDKSELDDPRPCGARDSKEHCAGRLATL